MSSIEVTEETVDISEVYLYLMTLEFTFEELMSERASCRMNVLEIESRSSTSSYHVYCE